MKVKDVTNEVQFLLGNGGINLVKCVCGTVFKDHLLGEKERPSVCAYCGRELYYRVSVFEMIGRGE